MKDPCTRCKKPIVQANRRGGYPERFCSVRCLDLFHGPKLRTLTLVRRTPMATENPHFLPIDIATMKKVTQWAVDAAKEHVDLATHTGETPDPETSMGLWQSFQRAFPKATTHGDYDVYINLYSHTYACTVRALTPKA